MKRSTQTLTGTTAITVMALLAGSSIAMAQEASPEASLAPESPAASLAAESLAPGTEVAGAAAHPLHIHDGTCDVLGDILFPLGYISTDLMVNGEPAIGALVGGMADQAAATDDQATGTDDQDVALNLTLVATTLADLTSNPHAINIHESDEAMGTYIACGDIAGSIVDGGTLVIRLKEIDGSGYSGFGLLREDGEGNTVVYSMLNQMGATAMTGAEPSAQPSDAMTGAEMSPAASDQASADSVTVTVDISVDASGEPNVEVNADEPEESPAA